MAVFLALLPATPAMAGEPRGAGHSSAAAAQGAPPTAGIFLRVRSGLRDGGRAYVMRGQRVVIDGRVQPFAPGQEATLVVSRRRRARTFRVPIVPHGARGRLVFSFRARATGRYTIGARHDPTPQLGALHARRVAVRSIRPRAHYGARGHHVRLLQRGLARLGYVTPRSGRFDDGTARALIAFRKVNGMARTGSAGREVFRKLFLRRGGFRLRHPKAGKHVEFDWSRQVLVLARRGRAERIYHASSGAMVTPTVFGSYRFYLKQPGTNAKRMVHSNYFIGGYAIHGYASVPIYPASHGCIRVPIPNALSIDAWIRLGDRIFIYR